MKIKRNIAFKLFAYGKAKDKFQIRLRVTFNGQRMDFSTGCQVYTKFAWNDDEGLVISGYIGPRGETAMNINNELRNLRDQMDTAFKYFEANDIYPTPEQIKAKYEERVKGTVPVKPVIDQQAKEGKKEPDFFECFHQFTREMGIRNAWTRASYQKFESLEKDLRTFRKHLRFDDLTEKTLTDFVCFLRDKKQLRTPRTVKEDGVEHSYEETHGVKNSTIDKKLGFLKWFLNWATDKGYNKLLVYHSFKPTLKQTDNEPLYLEKEELDKLQLFEIPPQKQYLERVRDVFLFCCFSGLRHSDVYNLRRSDIKKDGIVVTTIKTGDTLLIDYNSVLKRILDKYKDVPFPDDKALPVISNQQMNNYLKELCKLAGIDAPYRKTTYKGNERIDEIKPKYEWISSHCGRRTFCVMHLSAGTSPDIVRKWTGHKTEKTMRPYKGITERARKAAMPAIEQFDVFSEKKR